MDASYPLNSVYPCLDARDEEDWTCRTHDGTGLWCDNCRKAAFQEGLERIREAERAANRHRNEPIG